MPFTQFMYKLVRVVAFGFKALNFFLDIWQTWQFTVGGGVAMTLTAIITHLQNKPHWFIIVLAIAAGMASVCLALLISKLFNLKITERQRLKRLARLVYDIHKRISFVRNKLIYKTDWGDVDTSKVTLPLFNILGSPEINDNKIEELQNKLLASGSTPSGIASASDAIMKRSDTNLEAYLEKDFWYKFYFAQLDSYIPYPNKAIGDMVSKIINTSFSINNLLILQAYSSPSSLSLEALSESTSLSDVTRIQVYNVNVHAEKIMNDAITKACTELNDLVDEYLEVTKR